jgi:hypothetical protein
MQGSVVKAPLFRSTVSINVDRFVHSKSTRALKVGHLHSGSDSGNSGENVDRSIPGPFKKLLILNRNDGLNGSGRL